MLLAARDGAGWTAAAAQAREAIDAPLAAHRIGGAAYVQAPGATPFEDLAGIDPTGALLVRPDGHVGARWSALPADPAAELRSAVRQILDLGARG